MNATTWNAWRLVFIVSLGMLCAPAALAHSDLLEQIDVLSRQLELDPDNDEWLLKRGDLYRRHLDYAAAERDFDAAYEANPDNPLNAFFSGRLALETGEAQRADALLGAYLSKRPEDAAAWVLRGKAGMMLGEFARAAEDFGQAVARSPRPSPELFRLQVLALVAGDRYREALDVVDGGLARIPGEVNLIALGADTSLLAGDHDRAAAFLSMAPEPLFRIEHWQQLRERVTCDGEYRNGQAVACRGQAARELDRQIATLSIPSPPGH